MMMMRECGVIGYQVNNGWFDVGRTHIKLMVLRMMIMNGAFRTTLPHTIVMVLVFYQ